MGCLGRVARIMSCGLVNPNNALIRGREHEGIDTSIDDDDNVDGDIDVAIHGGQGSPITIESYKEFKLKAAARLARRYEFPDTREVVEVLQLAQLLLHTRMARRLVREQLRALKRLLRKNPDDQDVCAEYDQLRAGQQMMIFNTQTGKVYQESHATLRDKRRRRANTKLDDDLYRLMRPHSDSRRRTDVGLNYALRRLVRLWRRHRGEDEESLYAGDGDHSPSEFLAFLCTALALIVAHPTKTGPHAIRERLRRMRTG